MSILKLKDSTIHYKLYGNGPVLVFLHGLGDDLNYWNKLSKRFSDEFTVLLVDLRGHGKSKTNGEISNFKFQDDIYQLLQFLNIDCVNLIGFSLGGIVSMNFSLKHPEMVDKLVLISTFAKIDENLKYVHKDLYSALLNGLNCFYKSLFPLALPEEYIPSNFTVDFLKKDSYTIGETIKAYSSLDILDNIGDIDSPTLIIAGRDDDKLSSYSMVMDLFFRIFNSDIVFLANTKHDVLIKRNLDNVYNLIKSHLLSNR